MPGAQLRPATRLRRLAATILAAAAAATAASAGPLLGPGLRLEEARGALGTALAAYAKTGAAGAAASSPPSSALAGAPFADKVFHGTTTCAFVFDHGILVAVDSRASMGSYIGSGATEKVLPVSRHILATMAGGAADCAFWIRHLAMQARLHEVEHDGEPITVRRASKLLANNIARYLGKLSMGTMVLGHDAREGFSIYYVDHEGVRTQGRLFAVGSGSTHAYSILDAGYRPGMTVAEAAALGLKAIRHATYRDAFSGGFINVYHVDRQGWRRLIRVDAGYLPSSPSDDGAAGAVESNGGGGGGCGSDTSRGVDGDNDL